jgi:lysophospholipase L1-like esterase
MRLSCRARWMVAPSVLLVLTGCGDPATSPPSIQAPTGVTATELPSGDIQVSWHDNSDDETSFQLDRSSTGPAGTYATLASLGPDVSTYADAEVDGASQYCYRLRAIGAAGTTPSPFTTPVCHQFVTPAAPSELAASPTLEQVDLTWTDNSDSEAGFEIWSSADGAGGNFALEGAVAAGVVSYSSTGLQDAAEYCYRVRAVASRSRASAFSGTVCATTPTNAPATPTLLQAAAATLSRINVTWQDNAADEAAFEVWRSVTGVSGTYALRSTRAANSESLADNNLETGTEYCYEVRAKGAGSESDSPFAGPVCATTPLLVRVVLFGDSNTDRCEDHLGGSDPLRFGSYVSVKPALAPGAQHLSCSAAGKVVAAWNAARSESLLVVNHGIASTTTGGLGGSGDAARTSQSAPNARAVVNGVTRFEAEVLGVGAPDWSGGETNLTAFPNGAVTRVNAFEPKTNDFAYVSMGTNDDAGTTRTLTAQATADNLRWMIQGWTAAGHRADHFLLTTLAPRTDGTLNSPTAIPARNALIRALASELGVRLIDLAAHVSNDDGVTWSDPSLHIGDGVHYSETVRGWIGDQVVGYVSSKVPALP